MTNDTMTQGGYRFVALWRVGILLYSSSAYIGVRELWAFKAETIRRLQTMEDLLIRVAENLISRVSGPMKFRLILPLGREINGIWMKSV